MRAAVCHEHGQPLRIEDISIAEPVDRQIKVQVGACAICHSDIHYMQGAWGGELPAVFGHEASGVVTEVGSKTTRFQVGDRVIVTLIQSCGDCFYCDDGNLVMCDSSHTPDATDLLTTADGTAVTQAMKTGAFAEYVVVDESQAAHVPDDLPLDVASLLACGVITGAGAVLNTADVQSGASVVIVGAGGVGLNSIQAAAACDASTIIALDIEASKLEVAKHFGATHGLDASDPNVAKQIRKLTGGRGADHVFVTVGSKAAIDNSYRFIRRGGEVVIIGLPGLKDTSQFFPLALTRGVHTIRGSFMGETRLSIDIPRLIELHTNGRLKLDELISNRFPLEAVNEAVADTLEGQSLRNVLIVDESII